MPSVAPPGSNSAERPKLWPVRLEEQHFVDVTKVG